MPTAASARMKEYAPRSRRRPHSNGQVRRVPSQLASRLAQPCIEPEGGERRLSIRDTPRGCGDVLEEKSGPDLLSESRTSNRCAPSALSSAIIGVLAAARVAARLDSSLQYRESASCQRSLDCPGGRRGLIATAETESWLRNPA